jgi:hypothetical protein
MLLYLFDFRKVFFEGASKSSTAFFTVRGTKGHETEVIGRETVRRQVNKYGVQETGSQKD